MKYSEVFHTIQGEGVFTGVPSVFFRTSYCNMRCVWCSAIGTRVLRSDLTWQSIETLEPGDWIVGALRQDKGGHLQLQPTQVIESTIRQAPLVNVVTEDGIELKCSSDHPLYRVTTRDQDSSKVYVGWRPAHRFDVGDAVRCVLPPEDLSLDTESYERGWLCGMADGDGCFHSLKKDNKRYRRFYVALSNLPLLQQFHQFAKRAGYRLDFFQHRSSKSFKGDNVIDALRLTRSQEAESFERWLHADPQDDSYRRGWLSGFFDAEGSYSGVIRLAQNEGATKQKAIDFAEQLGFRPTSESKGIRLGGTTPEILRFYSLCQPAAIDKWKFWGVCSEARQHIASVSDAGIGDVVSLKTDSGTYISEGLLSHNCDTPYTSWNPENKDISVEDAVAEITQFNCKHVVITGGEPFIQKELVELCQRLRALDHYITIETAATRYLNVCADFISMSPKLSNSTPEGRFRASHELQRIRPDVIKLFLRDHFCQVKFVVDTDDDLSEIAELCEEIPIPRGVVTLMPQAVDRDELRWKQEWLINICKERNYRYSPRLHVEVWGTKRGV